MNPQSGTEVSFPRRSALTRNFRLGAPRSFSISDDGARVLFLRSTHGTDAVNRLWVMDVATGEETCIADPSVLLGGRDADAELTSEEKARRERVRESAGGIVTYSVDDACHRAVLTLGAEAFLIDVRRSTHERLALPAPAIDPRLDASGRRVAFVHDGSVWVHDVTGLASSAPVQISPHESSATVTWGLPDFVSAEEMDRTRGYWWTSEGSAIIAARVDVSAVPTWWINDPARPDAQPVEQRYPAAGSANADVRLTRLGLTGSSTPITWDHEEFEYLVDVVVDGHGELIVVQNRDQTRVQVRAVRSDGTTALVREQTDRAWVELIAGAPARIDDGRLVEVVDDPATDHRRLVVDGAWASPVGIDVRSIADVDGSTVLFTASPTTDARSSMRCQIWAWSPDAPAAAITDDGWSSGRLRSGTSLVVRNTLGSIGATATVQRSGTDAHVIASYAETPTVKPAVHTVTVGEELVRTAVLFPDGIVPDEHAAALPVLLDPYGGPHGQRVVEAAAAFLTSQWWADQGFVVIVTDGHGMPGRPSWEKSVRHDLVTAVLQDQVDALHEVAKAFPGRLDLTRVGIRGWSFGGYLAALAVLERPDVFRSAVAGAPVTDWRLYDTHYTERYLGTPQTEPNVYNANSLLTKAASLTRPLQLIHGLADDNVVAAHTLQLSSALLAAGKPHEVLPLSGVTHMTPQEDVAENLLLLQKEFLLRTMGVRVGLSGQR